jgi:uncharacterized membrane protein
MDKLLNLGRWIFPASFIMYVGLHFGKPDVGAAFVPDYLPFPYFWNYFTAVCIILFIVSALSARYDKLAYTLMALLVHLPRAMGHELGTEMMAADFAREKELEMVNFFRNIMVMGALLAFAKFVAKDKRVVG